MRRVSLRDVADRVRRLRQRPRRSFERFYAGEHDPFHFDSNPYEAAKFDDLLGVIGEGPFEHALEVGCSIGSFTERLAPRCGDLLATDISQVAVERTQRRLADHANVRVERRTIPRELPEGPFDLIVCSDVLYYLPARRLRRTLGLLAERLAPRGSIVSLHWLGDHGAPVSGDQVHDLQETAWRDLEHVARLRRDGVGPHGAGYRLDRYDRRP
jgi:cyclopropane fatty-acyl-phospholipid synthase-like methyltransferase